MSEPPKALTPPKLPWPGRTIAEAMPEFTQKHANGSDKRAEWKMKRRPFAGSSWSEK